MVVKQLLALKEQYKKLTGSDYKPSNASAPASASASAQKENQKPVSASSSSTSAEAEKLTAEIAQQGNKVRELKANKSSQVGQIKS